jgi:serine/threonine protein phosphatase PrpC
MRLFHDSRFASGASVIGPAHIKRNIPNQDSFLVKRSRKYTLLVVSDGMGSKPFADVGSAAACRAVLKGVQGMVAGKEGATSLNALLANILAGWKEMVKPHDPAECSATCLFVTARLGDGMVCLLGKSTVKEALSSDVKDDTFSNATQSLSDSRAASEFEVKIYDRADFCGVVMSSDGISSDMKSGAEIPFARDLYKEIERKFFWNRRRFLRNMMEKWPVPHHTDDKTIIVAGL